MQLIFHSECIKAFKPFSLSKSNLKHTHKRIRKYSVKLYEYVYNGGHISPNNRSYEKNTKFNIAYIAKKKVNLEKSQPSWRIQSVFIIGVSP